MSSDHFNRQKALWSRFPLTFAYCSPTLEFVSGIDGRMLMGRAQKWELREKSFQSQLGP